MSQLSCNSWSFPTIDLRYSLFDDQLTSRNIRASAPLCLCLTCHTNFLNSSAGAPRVVGSEASSVRSLRSTCFSQRVGCCCCRHCRRRPRKRAVGSMAVGPAVEDEGEGLPSAAALQNYEHFRQRLQVGKTSVCLMPLPHLSGNPCTSFLPEPCSCTLPGLSLSLQSQLDIRAG